MNLLARNKSIDATEGPLLKSIILYTVPLIISSIIQTLFSAVDMAVLGNMADSSSVASVGATTSITGLIISSCIGLSAGTKIILSRYIGSRDFTEVKKTISTSLITAVVLGGIIAVIGFVFAGDFLRLTKCPAECFEGAVVYTRIYLLAAPAILLYNYGSSVLVSSGDTQRPLYYIIAGGLLNVILNIVLCLILEQKVAAVAMATIASQILGAFLVVRRIFKMDGCCNLTLRELRGSWQAFVKIIKLGFPLCLHQCLYPLANLQIQSAINSYGVAAIAGNSASGTVEGIKNSLYVGFGQTVAVFAGQNLGANKQDRVKRCVKLCLTLAVTIATVVGVFVFLTGRFWLSIILKDDELAIDYGMTRMFFLVLFGFVSAVNQVLAGTIQTYGYTNFSAANSIFGILIFRILWMKFIYYPLWESFTSLMACFLVSWVVTMITNIVGYCVIYRRYKKGLVKRI